MKNESGLIPFEYKVLVLPDTVEEVTKGGIIRPQTVTEREQMAQLKALVIAVGGLAFGQDEGKPWPDAPKAGDRVVIAKYAGLEYKGADGKDYRIVNDKDIAAVLS